MAFVRGVDVGLRVGCGGVEVWGGRVVDDEAAKDRRVDDGGLVMTERWKDGPCVLRSSLQWGDQWRDRTEVLRGRES
jgi:hypothetical protein